MRFDLDHGYRVGIRGIVGNIVYWEIGFLIRYKLLMMPCQMQYKLTRGTFKITPSLVYSD